MHVQEPLKATLFILFDLQLTQQTDKPLEWTLVAIYPEEVDL